MRSVFAALALARLLIAQIACTADSSSLPSPSTEISSPEELEDEFHFFFSPFSYTNDIPHFFPQHEQLRVLVAGSSANNANIVQRKREVLHIFELIGFYFNSALRKVLFSTLPFPPSDILRIRAAFVRYFC